MTEEKMSSLMARFLKRGGKIDKSYLNPHKSYSHVVVNLNGWFGGKNVREAITRAISGQKVPSTGSAGSVGGK
jgi:hypothetical protein